MGLWRLPLRRKNNQGLLMIRCSLGKGTFVYFSYLQPSSL